MRYGGLLAGVAVLLVGVMAPTSMASANTFYDIENEEPLNGTLAFTGSLSFQTLGTGIECSEVDLSIEANEGEPTWADIEFTDPEACEGFGFLFAGGNAHKVERTGFWPKSPEPAKTDLELTDVEIYKTIDGGNVEWVEYRTAVLTIPVPNPTQISTVEVEGEGEAETELGNLGIVIEGVFHAVGGQSGTFGYE